MLASSRKINGAKSCMTRKNKYEQCLAIKKNPKRTKLRRKLTLCISVILTGTMQKQSLLRLKALTSMEKPRVVMQSSPASAAQRPHTPNPPPGCEQRRSLSSQAQPGPRPHPRQPRRSQPCRGQAAGTPSASSRIGATPGPGPTAPHR